MCFFWVGDEVGRCKTFHEIQSNFLPPGTGTPSSLLGILHPGTGTPSSPLSPLGLDLGRNLPLCHCNGIRSVLSVALEGAKVHYNWDGAILEARKCVEEQCVETRCMLIQELHGI